MERHLALRPQDQAGLEIGSGAAQQGDEADEARPGGSFAAYSRCSADSWAGDRGRLDAIVDEKALVARWLRDTGGVYLAAGVATLAAILISWLVHAMGTVVEAGGNWRDAVQKVRKAPWGRLIVLSVVLSSLGGALVAAWFPPYGNGALGMAVLGLTAIGLRWGPRLMGRFATAEPDPVELTRFRGHPGRGVYGCHGEAEAAGVHEGIQG
jgi:hypothetical protein